MYNCEKSLALRGSHIYSNNTTWNRWGVPFDTERHERGQYRHESDRTKDKSTKVGKVLHRYILSTVLIVYAG